MSQVTLKPLSTAKGSATRGGIVTIHGMELLFSYETLVGVKMPDGYYIQRDGLASSRTTGRHINRWLAGNPHNIVSEQELLGMAGMG